MFAPTQPSTFVIVRHGNTFEAGDLPRRIGARTDLPLTATGIAQAEALGTHFATFGVRFTRVLTSPLARTRQTASMILRHLPDTPEALPCDWLREIDHGPDENCPEDVVLARIGAEALAAWDKHAIPPPGWHVDANARITAWREMFGMDQGPVLIVTSNGAARYALVAAGVESSTGMKLPTGGYGVIRGDADGGFEVAEWGRRP